MLWMTKKKQVVTMKLRVEFITGRFCFFLCCFELCVLDLPYKRLKIREGEVWTRLSVRRKRGREPESNKTGESKVEGITTCYVKNLPTDITVKELERTFAKWGRIVDIYVAKKKEQNG